MSTRSECCVCLENYHPITSAPCRLLPCNHFLCQVCRDLIQQNSANRTFTCPTCRALVSGSQVDLSIIQTAQSQTALPNLMASFRDKDFIRDTSKIAFYGLDNSGSMGHFDGKTFLSRHMILPTTDIELLWRSDCIEKSGVTRWHEMVENVKLVALYNIRRGMKAVYMLLNPNDRSRGWLENIDFVIVDPSNTESSLDSLQVLFERLLSPNRVGGGTPLHSLTNEFRSRLTIMRHGGEVARDESVSYTLFTDGLPNSKSDFETSLRYLANECHLGNITINLTTDESNVVDYFNELDSQLGAKTRELEGTRFDVLDDLKAESQEISATGNRFLNYCLPFHITRMAGCCSAVADELDERILPPHYVAKLLKETLKIPQQTPHFSEGDAFLNQVRLCLKVNHKKNKNSLLKIQLLSYSAE